VTLREILAREEAVFREKRPKSQGLAERNAQHWLFGVPMHWMRDWGTPFPLSIARAEGATLTDADGLIYDDFCLGDTAAMFGHSPEPIARALAEQARAGLTTMLPSVMAARVGELLSACFGLPFWQVTATATDANRYALRWARAITGRPDILIFHGAYHGSAEDTFVRLENGRPILRPGLLGQVSDPRQHTRVVEFNDLDAVEEQLASGTIAAVLTEPIMTNTGMVLPQPDFLPGLRRAAERHGALLILDETHTLSSAYGGYGRAHGLVPDMLVVGKAIAGGFPTAVFGMSAETAARAHRLAKDREGGYSGMGTTLSANALALHALAASLSEIVTPDAYAHMLALGRDLARALSTLLARHGLPWHIAHAGARLEIVTTATPVRNASEAAAAYRPEHQHVLHLALLNRGVVVTPFHNMILLSPATERTQLDRLLAAFDALLPEIGALP
jgi:glutamate-1-semialdehyde 2,1-aminomutase